MSLDTQTLKAALEDIFTPDNIDELEEDIARSVRQQSKKIAREISKAISDFVKSGEVVVDTNGIVTAVTHPASQSPQVTKSSLRGKGKIR